MQDSLDPYQVLGIGRDAGEADVRRRYLELVRQFPPDREPEQFGRVRIAYEQLRDPVVRLKTQLFDLDDTDSWDAIVEGVRQRLRSARIPTAQLLHLAEQR